jgi:hypothetical protein
MLDPMDLTGADLHHLKAAVGWLELGNPAESLVELDPGVNLSRRNGRADMGRGAVNARR